MTTALVNRPDRLLTNSRMKLAQRCLRAHRYRYGFGLRSTSEAPALTFGKAVHNALAAFRQTHDTHAALGTVNATPWEDPYEHAKCLALLTAYFWYWAESDTRTDWVEVEQVFSMPLANPETDEPLGDWNLGGRMDGYDAEGWIWETKTTNESIEDDARYWSRLRLDSQINLYVLAQRFKGLPVAGVLYDVLRKPAHKPHDIPELDPDGLKIVLDGDGHRVFKGNGAPRQSAGEGMTLVTRIEHPEEYGARVYKEIVAKPSAYFRRQKIVRLEDDLEAYRRECWLVAKLLTWCEENDCWIRSVGKFTCDHCDYDRIDFQSIAVDPTGPPPCGFVYVDNPHVELLEENE